MLAPPRHAVRFGGRCQCPPDRPLCCLVHCLSDLILPMLTTLNSSFFFNSVTSSLCRRTALLIRLFGRELSPLKEARFTFGTLLPAAKITPVTNNTVT